MVMMVLKNFPFLPAVAFCSTALCPMSSGTQTVLLTMVITTGISVNSMAKQMEGKCNRVQTGCGAGVNPWDFHLQPQNNMKNFDGSDTLDECTYKTRFSVHCKIETV